MAKKQQRLRMENVLEICTEEPGLDLYCFHNGRFELRYSENNKFIPINFPDTLPEEQLMALIKKAKQELWPQATAGLEPGGGG